jgi:DNA-binding transcriptional LysR family regulator
LKLCLLSPDMQNRRIINSHFEDAGVTPEAMLESNSMIVLFSHVTTGRWASIMPGHTARSFGANLKIIPITEPEAVHVVGVVATHREPFTPLVSALLHEARLFSEKAD